MKIKEKLKKNFKWNHPESRAKAKVNEIAGDYKKRKENGDKDPMDNTVKDIIDILKQDPNEAILANIAENDDLPNEIFKKAATAISKDSDLPDSLITKAIDDTDTDIPDYIINKIIEDGKINVNERLKLIRNIEDKDILKGRIKSELKILYKNCNEKTDIEVTSRIKEIMSLIDTEDIDEEIQGWIQTVIAKKMAENFYSDIKQGTKIFEFIKIIPIEDMIEKGLASIVEDEYNKIEEERTKKGRFDKEKFEQQLFAELGKQVGIRYEETGVFIVPQSRTLKNMNEDAKTNFIRTIQTYARRQLTRDEIIEIDEQIRGTAINSKIKENTVINVIRNLPKEGKNDKIDLLTAILQDDKMFETIKELEASGLLGKLESMTEENRKKSIGAINNAVGKRTKYKVSTNIPKVNAVSFKSISTVEER